MTGGTSGTAIIQENKNKRNKKQPVTGAIQGTQKSFSLSLLDPNLHGFLSGLESDIFAGVQVNFFKRGERSK